MMPVMSGAEAITAIRRIESDRKENKKNRDDYIYPDTVIIAMTVSNLSQDEEDAIEAGCSDFIHKPISLRWLEKKISVMNT